MDYLEASMAQLMFGVLTDGLINLHVINIACLIVSNPVHFEISL